MSDLSTCKKLTAVMRYFEYCEYPVWSQKVQLFTVDVPALFTRRRVPLSVDSVLRGCSCPRVTISTWSVSTMCIPRFVTESRGPATVSQVWRWERSKAGRQMAHTHTHTHSYMHTLPHTFNTPKGTEIYCATQMGIAAACHSHKHTHMHAHSEYSQADVL